jgi:hypothetical protein
VSVSAAVGHVGVKNKKTQHQQQNDHLHKGEVDGYAQREQKLVLSFLRLPKKAAVAERNLAGDDEVLAAGTGWDPSLLALELNPWLGQSQFVCSSMVLGKVVLSRIPVHLLEPLDGPFLPVLVEVVVDDLLGVQLEAREVY